MSFWELVIFVLGLACPRTGILPFFCAFQLIASGFVNPTLLSNGSPLAYMNKT